MAIAPLLPHFFCLGAFCGVEKILKALILLILGWLQNALNGVGRFSRPSESATLAPLRAGFVFRYGVVIAVNTSLPLTRPSSLFGTKP
jgi:hypothetical protein